MDETPKRGPGQPRKNPLPQQPNPEPTTETPQPRRSALSLELKRTLMAGDRGGQVKMAQDRLKELGFFDGDSDAHYGQRLTLAVRQFQNSRGLRITGDINGLVWEALFTQGE